MGRLFALHPLVDAIPGEMKLFRAAQAGPGVPAAPWQSRPHGLYPLPLLSHPKSKAGGSGRADTGEHPSTTASLHPYGPPGGAPCATPAPHAAGKFGRRDAVLLRYAGGAARRLLAASPFPSPLYYYYYYYFKAPRSQAFLQNAEEKPPNSSSAGNAALRK